MSRHDHDNGLGHDLELLNRLIARRRMLGVLAGASLLPILGCGASSSARTGTGTGSGDASTGGSCAEIPEETGGPYPGDGSNGPNALTLSGIVRSDIRSSMGGLSGTAEGVPLTVNLSLVNLNDGCSPLAGYAIYLWHCDRDGHYSMYDRLDQNYLRGVQESDDTGLITFQTIFPACYSGRWPHIHFEVYSGLSAATDSSQKLKTSQLALPEASCNEVFATSGYAASVTNLSRVTLASDNVFSDGATLETPAVSGNVSDGYVASLTIAIAD